MSRRPMLGFAGRWSLGSTLSRGEGEIWTRRSFFDWLPKVRGNTWN